MTNTVSQTGLLFEGSIREVRKVVYNALEHFQYKYGSGIDNNIDAWRNNKRRLIELLSCHPKWYKDRYAIVFPYERKRTVDDSSVEGATRYFRRDEYLSVISTEKSLATKTIEDFIYRLLAESVNNADGKVFSSAFIEEYKKFGVSEGQKLSRAVGKIFKAYGLDRCKFYSADYAALSDTLSPKVIKEDIYLSLHPVDYLTMSYGNSWSSCQSIHRYGNGECHQGGVLSLMNDCTTMVLFNSKDKHHPYHKIWRQLFFFDIDDGMLLQTKLYPDDTFGTDPVTENRAIVQQILAECLGVQNRWKKAASENVAEHIHTHENSLHYPDYNQAGKYWFTYLIENYPPIDERGTILIGEAAFCIECGEGLDDEGTIDCCDTVCKGCGCHLSGDEIHQAEDNDGIYCEECIEYCDHCGAYFSPDSTSTVYDGDGDRIRYCDNCCDNHTWVCDKCGDRYSDACESTDIESTDDSLCSDCAEEYAEQCEECSHYFYTDNLTDGPCSDCMKEKSQDEETTEETADAKNE